MGINQARRWNVGSLNEFRKFFGLKSHETFEEINSDPEIADELRNLYEHPDFVELYPGIVSEEAKEPMAPGVGIAPTYTISRAVLSDAVALVRGDRHYTVTFPVLYNGQRELTLCRSIILPRISPIGATRSHDTISVSTRDVSSTSFACEPSRNTSNLIPFTPTTP